MKKLSLALALLVSLDPTLAWCEGQSNSKAPIRYSMLNGLSQRSSPGFVIKAACTGSNTCCCRAGNQIFCTTPDACSRMGGACSAGCN
jgi:hypothetical protein